MLTGTPLGINIAVFTAMAHSRKRASGLALLETMVAATILVFALTSLYFVFGHARSQMAEINDNSVIQSNLEAQHERLRQTGWGKLIDPSQLASQISSPLPNTQSNIVSLVQEYIIAYPASVPYVAPAFPTPTPYFTITRSGTGVTISPSTFKSTTLFNEFQIQYVIGIQWQSRGRLHVREVTSLLSKSGSP